MNWKGCGARRSWLNLRYCFEYLLGGTERNHEIPESPLVSVPRWDSNLAPPDYKPERNGFRQLFWYVFLWDKQEASKACRDSEGFSFRPSVCAQTQGLHDMLLHMDKLWHYKFLRVVAGRDTCCSSVLACVQFLPNCTNDRSVSPLSSFSEWVIALREIGWLLTS
jgi:hypothetical protein